MVQLAVRQLHADPLRSALTMAAIAAVIAVILVLRGFEQGLYQQSRDAVLGRGADLFVVQSGVQNFVAVRSSLRQLARRDVEEVPGVAEAHPITSFSVIYEKDSRKVPIYLMVYDKAGGPGRLVEGHAARSARDAVIDHSLARKYGLRVGDPLTVAAFDFTISGIADREAAFFMSFVFVTYDGLLDFVFESDIAPDLSAFPLVSHLLVELEPGADPDEVRSAIEAAVADLDAYLPIEMAQRDVQMGQSLFGPIMGLLAQVAYAVGLLVVGLIAYADVRAQRRSFGVLKALGFRLRHLATTVIVKMCILLIAALPVAALIALGVAEFIETVAPLYRVPALESSGLVETFLAGVVFALLGAMLPLRSLKNIDPASAFRGT
jgi:putative ABC transport system permease protein